MGKTKSNLVKVGVKEFFVFGLRHFVFSQGFYEVQA